MKGEQNRVRSPDARQLTEICRALAGRLRPAHRYGRSALRSPSGERGGRDTDHQDQRVVRKFNPRPSAPSVPSATTGLPNQKIGRGM